MDGGGGSDDADVGVFILRTLAAATKRRPVFPMVT
jgi:hypothetical protein